MVEIHDNFLDDYYIDYLLEAVDGPGIPWKYHHNVSIPTPGDYDEGWKFGFSHLIFDAKAGINFQDTEGDVWLPAIMKMETQFNLMKGSLMRSRLDMTVRAPKNVLHTPHTDQNFPHYTFILYMKDSDGETIIYNETNRDGPLTIKETIEPKKNRLIFFDGDLVHTGHSPCKTRNRILLNTNFLK